MLLINLASSAVVTDFRFQQSWASVKKMSVAVKVVFVWFRRRRTFLAFLKFLWSRRKRRDRLIYSEHSLHSVSSQNKTTRYSQCKFWNAHSLMRSWSTFNEYQNWETRKLNYFRGGRKWSFLTIVVRHCVIRSTPHKNPWIPKILKIPKASKITEKGIESPNFTRLVRN